MPRELTQRNGDIAWEAVYQAWGNTVSVEWQEVAQAQELNPIQLNAIEQSYLLQPHRFQGQIYDNETGLHYNRFRYYDPDAGRFISHDPIGLLGGDNQFQYAPNPVGWVDPLGLARGPLTSGEVYRQGSATNSNLTPRPGKDTTTGLSTTIEQPSGKFQTLDVAKLNDAGLEVIQDGNNHASVRPKNDPNFEKLREWADTRGTDNVSDYTIGCQNAIVDK